jgi:2-C-methyl-D-erythritol 4-phosphate cytidylyltransferase/2-C-methyl-D-erythritol 2,4-cyclodiphosphate synthase
MQRFQVIIPAAGKGTRFGADTPKQYTMLHGKPLIQHAIDAFQAIPECAAIHVIIDPNDAHSFHETLGAQEKLYIAHGGKERKDSVYKALKSISHAEDEELILIHDAARPCVHPADITALLDALQTHRAATLALPVASTLRRSNAEGIAQDSVSRDNLWAIQTPQAFRYGDLIKAHDQSDPQKTYTDDTQLVSELGIPVKCVQCSPNNIKVTMPQDLDLIEKIMSPAHETRSGMGFDVHAFDADKSGPVRLCGVDVAHDHALKGHSDADVGLHTLTDAIFGAIGQGDIGQHFPPSDDTFKDMDSAVFLQRAMETLRTDGGQLINADICEAPKIGPHASAMRDRIAEICGVSPRRINVKATTTEQLGFTGRKEGIAAQAIINISYPAGDA